MGSPSLSLNPSWLQSVGMFVTALAVFAGMARYIAFDWADYTRCGQLLNRGSWLDTGLKNWQPDGCMLYNYNPTQATSCLESKPVVFIGDSVARTLFFQLAHLIDPSLPPAPVQDGKKHANHTLTVGNGNSVSFFWDPFLNSTHTLDVVRSARDDTHRPALLVLGSGLWYLRYSNSSGGLPSWEVNMEHLLAEMIKGPVRPADQIVVLPVEQVVPSKLTQERALSMHLSDIDAMNSDLKHRIHPPYSGLPFSSRPTSPVSLPLVFNEMLMPSQTEDGLHFSSAIVKTQAQILLNLRCNNLMPKQFPLDKTCCNTYPWPSLLYLSILLIIFSWGPILAFLSYRAGSKQTSWLKETQNPALVFSFGVALTFFADRSGLWLKEQKHFNPWTFTFLCLVALSVGLATIKRSDKDLGFMNREQTDEWKGWMQLAILIYHYLGASKISGIYNPIRVLVASYLFMTGYGHTTFYLRKADFGFLRVAQVMVRLNLLTLVLAYTMNTDYISYYFSPLVSMWYLIVYTTMSVGSRYNDRTSFVLGKVFVSASLFTLFVKEKWLLEMLFSILNRLCGIHWSAREWNFRVTLDLWIVYIGMLAAIAVIKIRDNRLTEHPYWAVTTKVSIALSALCIVWFFAFELFQESKFTYNLWHPYISWIPILAFAVLRNASVILRSASSSAFAFIGRCSLETFIIQYHLWLAGDTKGVLLVIPGTAWRPVNFVLSTVMFVYVSDQMARATTTITSWICSGTAKPSSLPLPNTSSGTVTASSDHRDTDASSSNGATSIPLGLHNSQKDEPSEHDTPRWIDRLAEGSASPPRTRSFRIWQGKSEGYGVKTKLFIGIGTMWAANIFWQY